MRTTIARLLAGCAFACLVGALWLSGPAKASCLSQTVGLSSIHNCDGKIGVSQTVGTTTIHSIDGKFGLSQSVGGLTLHSGPLFDTR